MDAVDAPLRIPWTEVLELSERMSTPHRDALFRVALTRADAQTQISVLQHHACSSHLLDEMAAATSGRTSRRQENARPILVAAASNPNMSPNTLEQLLLKKVPGLPAILATNPRTPATALARIASDYTSTDIAARIARNPNTDTHTLHELSHRRDSAVRDALLQHPNLAHETLQALLGAHPDLVTLHAAARNPALPREMIAEWLSSSRKTLLRILASNPQLTSEELEALAWNGDPRCQIAVASNPSLGADLAELLTASTSNTATRLALANNAATPRAAIENLLVDHNPKVRRLALERHRDIPTPVLLQVTADESDPGVCAALARHPRIPNDHLARFINPYARSLRSASGALASRTTRLPASISDALFRLGPAIAARVAARADCPRHLIAQAAAHTDFRVRRAAGINEKTPVKYLVKLTQDSDPITRILAASHPTLEVA